MITAPWRLRVPIHLRREVVTMTMLTGLAAVLLIGVTALSELYHAQLDALADRWAGRGAADLASGNFNAAATEYRTALRYARDGYSQQLGLAEALIGMRRVNEASVYLENLWEQQPENGIVNRELARIAAGKGDTRAALRYYHNAIYATWPGNAELDRENTRWELIKYLLGIHASAQAQSELILLGAEVGDNPIQQLNLGQYFLKVQDGQHALAAFRLVLHTDPHSARALAGAGEAAFDLGDYPLAEHYLSSAIAHNPADSDSASLLEVTSEVMRLDPFRRQISDAGRDQAVLGAFQAVGDRLHSCPAAANLPASASAPQTLAGAWAQLKPKVNARELRRNQDVVNQAMNLAFSIERAAAGRCGSGTPSDTALLLISRLHEGS